MEIINDMNIVRLWPLGLVILMAALALLMRRNVRLPTLFCAFVFGIYLLLLVDRVFFPIRILAESFDLPTFERAINLVPLKFNFSELPGLVVWQIVENILLTIPIGFAAGLFSRLKTPQLLWLALSVGVGLELGQLVIGLILRYPYRIVDINDALLNAVGIVLGYAFFRLAADGYGRFQRRSSVTHEKSAA